MVIFRDLAGRDIPDRELIGCVGCGSQAVILGLASAADRLSKICS